jgi:hypothetical protein
LLQENSETVIFAEIKTENMKTVFALVSFLLVANLSHAQAFEKGRNYIHFGFGTGPSGVGSANNLFYNYGVSIGIIAGYERGITEKLGIGRIGAGGLIGQSFQSFQSYELFNSGWISTTSLVGRAAYHFDFNIDKMDVYAGIGAGVNIPTGKYKTISTNSLIQPNLFAGIRYYFTSEMAVYGELGYGASTINIGLVYRL